jgi:hypothetical protein
MTWLPRRRRPAALAGTTTAAATVEPEVVADDATGSAPEPVAPVDPAAGAEATGGLDAKRVGLYLAVLVAGSIISGFLDPDFGLDKASVTFVIGVLASSLVGSTVGWLAGRGYRQARKLPTPVTLDAVPSGLLVAAVAVLISRLVKFEPGYLYGLVGGLAFVAGLEGRDEGRSQFTVIMTRLAVAIGAWLAFVPVSVAANKPGAGTGTLVLDAILATAFIGGVEGTLFGLVPIRLLPGHEVSRWSWIAWGVTASIAAFLFVDVLLRPESGYLGKSSTASAVVVYALFALFGLLSVAFYLWFRLRPDDPHATPPDEVSGETPAPA